MNESQALLLADVKNAVADIFHRKVSENISYHNLQHTRDVVAACEKMADHYQLSDEDRTALFTAAWFHDTGFSSGSGCECSYGELLFWLQGKAV